MNDNFERRLTNDLKDAKLPAAPDALRDRVRAIATTGARADTPRGRPRLGRAGMVIPAAAAVALLSAGAALFMTGRATVVPTPTADLSTPHASASLAADSGVLTVSQAIDRLTSGRAGSERVTIGGFWSDASVRHGCAAPKERPGVLELYCTDGEFGITERNEPIEVIDPHGLVTPGTGPSLSPFVDQSVPGASTLFGLPQINGQPYPPVPIVVVGHFNDPRWKDCRAEAQPRCKARLVIDSIVRFDPASASTPAPTPSPTPFPYADPPPAPFDAEACAGRAPIASAEWTTLGSVGIDIGDPNDVAYVMITRDPIPIGGWYDDPNGTRYRAWARRVCYAYEWSPEAIGYEALPGTLFKEFPDGHQEPA